MNIVNLAIHRSLAKPARYSGGFDDKNVVAINVDDDGSLSIETPVTMRLFYNRDRIIRAASVYINCGSVHGFGHSGHIPGCGFHRESAAAENALADAGVSFDCDLTCSRDVDRALLMLAAKVAAEAKVSMHTFTII